MRCSFKILKRKYSKDNGEKLGAMNIQLLNEYMHKQLFPTIEDSEKINAPVLNENCVNELKKFNLWNDVKLVKTPKFKLPELQGQNINEHFKKIGTEMSKPYKKKLNELVDCSLPKMPTKWSKTHGWTKYIDNGTHTRVEFPDEEAIVFDCEVLVRESSDPVMAVAVSKNYWYSWTSKSLNGQPKSGEKQLDNLIPLETSQKNKCTNLNNSMPRVVVGHNVGYDRARVKEQFYFKESKIRFVDTLSMHVAVGGLVGAQRGIAMADKKIQESLAEDGKTTNKENWLKYGSMNNLSDVHNLYCGSPLDKEKYL